MLKQKELIANVKNLTESDERITACMMYGSFTKGEGDQYSDIEFYKGTSKNSLNFPKMR